MDRDGVTYLEESLSDEIVTLLHIGWIAYCH